MDAFITLILNFAIPTLIVSAVFVGILFFVLPREVRTIFKRELKSYFTSPIAYVLFVVFLGISSTLSFFFTGVLEGGEADLFLPYFQYLPWYLVLIAPAVGMRLWSEEQRLGTLELMLTMPLAPWHAILGKYLAAGVVLFTMLVLSFPIVWTINFLGDPDNGVIMSGFVATLFVALCFLAVTSVISAITRSQLVALLVSVALCMMLWLSGLPHLSELIMNLKGGWLVFWPILKLVNVLGVMPHFTELAKGVLGLRDIVFFLTFIAFCLFATSVAIRLKRA
ncbi:MAG: ABC transporter permease subunit [Verrucomicrobiales bacterium]|nr:ABC transporter permease subunit [Verrucomicrobiales bacterium]HQW30217.1 ABC transporter permease [Verrucomicrobiales bacterium]